MDIQREPKKKRGRYVIAAVGLATVAIATVALGRLKPAAPTVERATIWVDSVRRGPMLLAVRGPGTLAPEQIRWIAAITAGRVERVGVRPGATVRPGDLLVELSNPDVQLQALDAERQLGAAQSQLVNLRTTLEGSRLTQAGLVAQMRSQYSAALREAASAETLAVRNLISQNDLARAHDQVEELASRVDFEGRRLALLTSSIDSQVSLERAQVERLRNIAQFHGGRVASMRVVAPVEGVVQDLQLEVGQYVQSGTTLARIVQPGRLKAVLRISETQARDVALGQEAEVDTRNGVARGRVVRIDPAVQNGTVGVDIGFEGDLPAGARPDLSVDGTIEIANIGSTLQVGRPAYGQANSTIGLFRLTPNGREATRVSVRIGRGSVNLVEVLEGLVEGDRVVLSDMTRYDAVDRVRIR